MKGKEVNMKQYIVDAFASEPFAGNPAAVCVMDEWPEEEFMKKLAMENSLSETAFLVKEENGYRLRWFTPETEVDLCGHATLASGFTVLNYYEEGTDTVIFNTRSGQLSVTKKEDRYEMDFPVSELKEIPVTDEMEAAFGARPVKAVLGMDLICVFEDEETVRTMSPESSLLMKLPGRIQNPTARGKEYDCVSRSFAPKLGIFEDPVCGSAHCQIAAYWADVLGKKEIIACQASKRSGVLYCCLKENQRISLSGRAVLVGITDLKVMP